jgi:hypothetical protein
LEKNAELLEAILESRKKRLKAATRA